MEKGAKRPDTPATAYATVRAAVAEAARRCPGLPLIAGGKSFGARMTSQAQAASPLPGVLGLAFLGFPLHPAGKPSDERAAHLFDVTIPMLFLQGTRDKLADLPLLRRLVDKLGSRASLHLFEDADHSFHVPVRSGRNDRMVMGELLDVLASWMYRLTQTKHSPCATPPFGRTGLPASPLDDSRRDFATAGADLTELPLTRRGVRRGHRNGPRSAI
jgi:uncharacterized protein